MKNDNIIWLLAGIGAAWFLFRKPAPVEQPQLLLPERPIEMNPAPKVAGGVAPMPRRWTACNRTL